MAALAEQLNQLNEHKNNAIVGVQTLGGFATTVNGSKVSAKAWGREKTIQLFQFLISNRHRNALHKEQIINRLWDEDGGDKDFKVALHGINKVLEPNRKARTEPEFVIRQGSAYALNLAKIWIDVEALEQYATIGNKLFYEDKKLSKAVYEKATNLYKGIYLPNRIYEDWSSEERERMQVLAINTFVTLAEIELNQNANESIRLAQNALAIDSCWESAYRILMKAYFINGNRPQAIKTFNVCCKVLEEAYGIQPLPKTKQLMDNINKIV